MPSSVRSYTSTPASPHVHQPTPPPTRRGGAARNSDGLLRSAIPSRSEESLSVATTPSLRLRMTAGETPGPLEGYTTQAEPHQPSSSVATPSEHPVMRIGTIHAMLTSPHLCFHPYRCPYVLTPMFLYVHKLLASGAFSAPCVSTTAPCRPPLSWLPIDDGSTLRSNRQLSQPRKVSGGKPTASSRRLCLRANGTAPGSRTIRVSNPRFSCSSRTPRRTDASTIRSPNPDPTENQTDPNTNHGPLSRALLIRPSSYSPLLIYAYPSIRPHAYPPTIAQKNP